MTRTLKVRLPIKCSAPYFFLKDNCFDSLFNCLFYCWNIFFLSIGINGLDVFVFSEVLQKKDLSLRKDSFRSIFSSIRDRFDTELKDRISIRDSMGLFWGLKWLLWIWCYKNTASLARPFSIFFIERLFCRTLSQLRFPQLGRSFLIV